MIVVMLGFVPKYLVMKAMLLLLCYACGVTGRKRGSLCNSYFINKVIFMSKVILASFSKSTLMGHLSCEENTIA